MRIASANWAAAAGPAPDAALPVWLGDLAEPQPTAIAAKAKAKAHLFARMFESPEKSAPARGTAQRTATRCRKAGVLAGDPAVHGGTRRIHRNDAPWERARNVS